MNEDYYIRPDIDLILLDEEELQIRFLLNDKESLSIEGKHALQLYNYLSSNRSNIVNKEDQKKYYKFCIDNGLLCTNGDTSGAHLPCFSPILLESGCYAVRVSNRIYFYSSSSAEETVNKFEKVARACIADQDRAIFLKLLTSPKSIKMSPSICEINLLNAYKKNGDLINKINHFLLIENNPCGNLIISPKGLFRSEGDDICKHPYWGKIINCAIEEQIITECHAGKINTDHLESSMIKYGCKSSFLLPVLDDSKYQFCYGTGQTETEAVGKACMEAMERFFAQLPLNPHIEDSIKSLDEKNTPYIYPADMLHDEKYKNNNIDNERISWIKAKTINENEYLLPRIMCQYGPGIDNEHVPFSNSNGCSAHLYLQEAIWGGIKECIERDALLMHWYNKVSPPYIPSDLLSYETKNFLSGSISEEYEIKILDVTLDTLPVILVVGRSRKSTFPYFLCGAACSEDYGVAIEKALAEFTIILRGLKGGKFPPMVKKENIQFPSEHGIYYLDPSHQEEINFLFNGVQIKNITLDTKREISLQKIDNIIGPIYIVDLKADRIPNLNIHVVKTVIPTLVPITFGYKADPFYHPRLRDMGKIMNDRKICYDPEDIIRNYHPHFFT